MCDRFLALMLCAVCVLSFCGCQRQIMSPGDELSMYSWSSDFDNGTSASLTFDGDIADFTCDSADFSLTVRGLYVYTDDTLLICDENSQLNYSFGYKVYGDRTELSLNGSAICLEKQK